MEAELATMRRYMVHHRITTYTIVLFLMLLTFILISISKQVENEQALILDSQAAGMRTQNQCPAPIRYGGESSCQFGLKGSFTVICNGEERAFTSKDCGVGVCMNQCQINQCIAAKCDCTADTSSCEATPKRVFITSVGYTGNLGGLLGADAKCQSRAVAEGLSGTWKAWLSDTQTSASSRLTHNAGLYQMLNGTIIANNWGDLTDGTIQHKIDIDERGAYHGYRPVWTYTLPNGDRYVNPGFPNTHCSNWIDETFNENNVGVVGVNAQTDYNWTNMASASCNITSPAVGLYCFEQ